MPHVSRFCETWEPDSRRADTTDHVTESLNFAALEKRTDGKFLNAKAVC